MTVRKDDAIELADSPFIRTQDVARRLGVSLGQAYGLLHAGIVPSQRNGKRFLVHRTEFEEWLREGRPKPTAIAQPAQAPQATLPAGVRVLEHDNGDTEIVISIRISQSDRSRGLKVPYR
jgi:excisionase family DNA binding protein